ncbi:endonuclease VIII [Frankia sp. AiPs1]|nr:Fpg/Nei family DNA glycosylase [Frankia sp. AiPa1]
MHRLSAAHQRMFRGHPVRASSPQGRFTAGAHRLDGQILTGAEAHGKHLLLGFGGLGSDGLGTDDLGSGGTAESGSDIEGSAESAASRARQPGARITAPPAPGPRIGLGEPALVLHVHLGIYGAWSLGQGPAPAPTGAVRLRLTTAPTMPYSAHDAHGAHVAPHPQDVWYADLRGPNACELLEPGDLKVLRDRLGPDPLRSDADPDRAYRRIARSRTPIATLLMDQSVVAGPGNIYRAEVLFRAGVPPLLAGRDVSPALWSRIWSDLVALMADGVRTGRIDTVRPQHMPEAMGRPPRVDDHGGEVYVYRRAGLPCLVCGTAVRTGPLAGRNLFWCPGCQPAPGRSLSSVR